MIRVLGLAFCVAMFAAVAAPVQADALRDLCLSQGHPEFAFGDARLPESARPLFGCAARTGARGDADEQFIEGLADSAPDNFSRAGALVRLGWKWIGQRQPGSAINRFNLAWRFAPDDGDVYHGIAVTMSELGQPTEVIDYWFAQAVSKTQGRPGRFADYGRYMVANRRHEEARPVLIRALELEPGNAWAMMYLADVHFWLEERKQGCAMILRILESSPPQGFPKVEFDKLMDHWRNRAAVASCPMQ
ncbi:MAG: tetratricopeptide repeat protein [Minwuia sp.]|nr:tetratricopeptide repeat protein [Minwuia sp.]